LVQMANSNRFALSKELYTKDNESNELCERLRLGSGFISVHRSKEKAEDAMREAREFGEAAELISLQTAIDLEPRIKNLPFKESFFVHRPNDQTANCLAYIISSIKALQLVGVKYRNDTGHVEKIESISPACNCNGRFRVTTTKQSDNYDYVILANGVFAPILATKLGIHAGLACPTFPLKGYSLTLLASRGCTGISNTSGNYLKKSLSFDNIYCTSVGAGMVRLAGFGEIVGFPKGEDDYLKSTDMAMDIFQKYTSAIFAKELNFSPDFVIPCYRPMSPDDLPLVGEVTSFPGLYFHTGHGTLGWTLCLTTAHCLAQDICDDIEGIGCKTKSFLLPDGTEVPKSILSPNRFY
jgi:D-amino-acid dehydrogenase